MGSEAPARLFYERSLGLLDAAVGNALGDFRLAKRGSALAERSDALRRAAQLDAAADQARQQSSADLKATSDTAIKEQQGARAAGEREVDGPAAQPRAQACGTRAAAQLPPPRDARRRVAAQRRKCSRSGRRNKPEFGRTSRRPPRPPSQSSTMSTRAHPSRQQACARGPGRGAGRQREAEAPI